MVTRAIWWVGRQLMRVPGWLFWAVVGAVVGAVMMHALIEVVR